MKRIILFLILLGLIPLYAFPQKLRTDYKLYFITGDSIEMTYELLSRKRINKLLLFAEKKGYTNKVIKITDSDKRVFEYITHKNDTIIAEKIVDGYYSLYATEPQKYFLKHDTTVLVLERIEEIVDNYIHVSDLYKRAMFRITTDLPEFRERINRLKFAEKDIKDLVHDINNKKQPGIDSYVSKNLQKQFFYVSANWGSDIMSFVDKHAGLDIQRIIYIPSISNSFSFRTGLGVKLFQTHNITLLDFNGQSEYYEKLNDVLVGIPLILNTEITNSTFTPYASFSIFPAVHLYGKHIGFGSELAIGLGLRTKISAKNNIRTGIKFGTTGLFFDLGIEFINARKHR